MGKWALFLARMKCHSGTKCHNLRGKQKLRYTRTKFHRRVCLISELKIPEDEESQVGLDILQGVENVTA
jgi:hypothetical protein